MSEEMKKNKFGKKNLSLHQEIVSEISENLFLKKGVVKEVVDEYLRILRREIINRGDVLVKSLFSVKTAKKPAHKRRHIKTGEIVEHPESEYLTVSLSQPLRDEFRKNRGYVNSDSMKTGNDSSSDFNPFLDDD